MRTIACVLALVATSGCGSRPKAATHNKGATAAVSLDKQCEACLRSKAPLECVIKSCPTEPEPASALVSPTVYPYPEDGVVVGQGWNGFLELGTPGSCVQVIEVPIEASSFETSVREIKSTYSLYKDRSVTAMVSGGFGGFGASVSASNQTNRKLQTDQINVLFSFLAEVGSTRALGIGGLGSPSNPPMRSASARAEPRNRTGSGIELSEHARQLLADNEIARFQKLCGDGYVSAIHRGSRVDVLATFQGSSIEDRVAFRASLKAEGFGIKGSATYQSSSTVKLDESKTRYSISQIGGLPFGPPSEISQVKGMFTEVEHFVENPAAFRVTVMPYESLADFPVGARLESPRRLNRLGRYHMVLSDLDELVSELLELALDQGHSRSKFDSGAKLPASAYTEKMIEAYGGAEHLSRLSDVIHRDLRILESGIGACYRQRKGCTELAVQRAATLALHNELERLKSARKSAQETKKKIDAARGDQEMIRAALSGELGREIDKVETAIAQLDTKLDSLDEEQAALDSITGVLDQHAATIDEAFFQRFYQYLIELPLPETQFKLTATAKSDDKVEAVVPALKRAIRRYRLLPWKNYFCRESLSAGLCLYDSELDRLLEDAELTFIKEHAWIEIPYEVCTYRFKGRTITAAQYGQLRRRLGRPRIMPLIVNIRFPQPTKTCETRIRRVKPR